MTSVWRQILVLIVVFLPDGAGAEEAVTHEGRRYPGTLRTKDFLLAGAAKQLPLAQLHLVQFPQHPAPLPRCRLLNQLLFTGDQRLTGELLAVGAKDLRFRIASGESFTLSRGQVQGVVPADAYLTQWAEDFEDNKGGPLWSGKPIFSEEHAFSGKRSLLVNGASHDLSLAIGAVQKPETAYRATLFFFDPGPQEGAVARIDFVFKAQEASVPVSLQLGSRYHDRDHGFQLKASPGWHVIQLDWNGGEARAFIDDYFITSQTIPANARLTSCRFYFEGQGGMWFDSLQVAAKAAPARRTPGPPELDEVWLASGDQVFGAVRQADAHAVVFEGGFGKRTFPWSNVRGVFFRSEATPPALKQSVEVRFRSAPGVSADQLTGTIVDLNDRDLVLQHPVLGKVAIARSRLHRIRFPEPAGK
jgi:hypothetical protein